MRWASATRASPAPRCTPRCRPATTGRRRRRPTTRAASTTCTESVAQPLSPIREGGAPGPSESGASGSAAPHREEGDVVLPGGPLQKGVEVGAAGIDHLGGGRARGAAQGGGGAPDAVLLVAARVTGGSARRYH